MQEQIPASQDESRKFQVACQKGVELYIKYFSNPETQEDLISFGVFNQRSPCLHIGQEIGQEILWEAEIEFTEIKKCPCHCDIAWHISSIILPGKTYNATELKELGINAFKPLHVAYG